MRSLLPLMVLLFGLPAITFGKHKPTVFHYFHKSDPTKALTREEVLLLENKPENVYVYTHGFMTSDLGDAGAVGMKDALLEKRKDIDLVIIADWMEESGDKDITKYPQVAGETTPKVAEDIFKELETVREEIGLEYENVELGGHSLGAHVMGQVGRAVTSSGKGKIKQINALDPAGPYFRSALDYKHLRVEKEDASFVRVIHTDPRYGLWEDVGHLDLYPYDPTLMAKCDEETKDHVCLHAGAVDLRIREIRGETIGDPADPQRGKERKVSPWFYGNRHSTKLIIFVLDVSPSMQNFSRIDHLISSCQNTILSLPINTTVAIVIFGGTAQVPLPPTTLRDEETRARMLRALPTNRTFIYSTSIGAGLKAAYGLDRAKHSCPDVILITDGEENRAPYMADVQTPPCTRVNPIALGDKADLGLEALSKRTNGRMSSASDVDSMNTLYRQLMESVYDSMSPEMRPVRLPTRELKWGWGQSEVESPFIIDPEIGKDFKLSITSPSLSKLHPSLLSPSKEDFPESAFSRNGDFLEFRNNDMEPGQWNLKIKADTRSRRSLGSGSRSPTKASVSMTSFKKSDGEKSFPVRLKGQLSTNLLDYSQKGYEPLTIYGKLMKGQDAIIGALVKATIASPNGTVVVVLDLFDDGNGADEEAFDGVYSRQYFSPLTNGERFEVTVTAKCGSGEKCRIRPDSTFSQVQLTSEEDLGEMKLQGLHNFERETGAGSIRTEGTYSPPIFKISDLHVSDISEVDETLTLAWTLPEGLDFTTNLSYIFYVTSNFSVATMNDISLFHHLLNLTHEQICWDVDMEEEGPILLTGEYSFCLSDDIWAEFVEERRLYFTLAVLNSDSSGVIAEVDFSHAAIALFPDDDDDSDSSIATVIALLITLVFTFAGIMGIFFGCRKAMNFRF